LDIIDVVISLKEVTMENNRNAKELVVKTTKRRLPKWAFCPFCGLRQPFRKKKEHYKKVKDINTNQPLLLKIQIVCVKCENKCSKLLGDIMLR
jgi:hypothetical protein